jgi:N-methylhydantoinase B
MWGEATMSDAVQTADPATFEIVKNSFYKIAEEMRVVLAKTAYSPLLKSAGDYSCGVFDARGAMVAQGPDLPIHLGSMPDAVRAIVAAFASDVHEGDVFLHNDPYFGGSHLPDVNVVRPAFYEGRLLGYTCLRAHWPDVGSATPGSYGAVTEIFGEGLRLPPLRLINRGALNVDVEKLILANVRTPDERKAIRRPARRDPACNRTAQSARPTPWRRRAHWLHGAGHGLLGPADARDAYGPPGRGRDFRGFLRWRWHRR